MVIVLVMVMVMVVMVMVTVVLVVVVVVGGCGSCSGGCIGEGGVVLVWWSWWRCGNGYRTMVVWSAHMVFRTTQMSNTSCGAPAACPSESRIKSPRLRLKLLCRWMWHAPMQLTDSH